MIKFYHSNQAGAPQIFAQAESIIGVLDAVLINGFNINAIDSLTRSGSVATATINSGHLYTEGDILNISGADQSEYNGDFEIFNIHADSFSFLVSDTAVTPATGSIISKISPAGWSEYLYETNKKIYKYPGGHQYFLIVDENTSSELSNKYSGNEEFVTSKFYVTDSVTDIDNFGSVTKKVYVRKAFYAGNGPSNWFVVASSRGLFIGIGWNASNTDYDISYFGEFNSLVPNDAFNLFSIGHYTYSGSAYHMGEMYTGTKAYYLESLTSDPNLVEHGSYLLRDSDGLIESESFFLTTLLRTYTEYIAGNISVPFYSLLDGSVRMCSLYLKEHKGIRGTIPGVYIPLCKNEDFNSKFLRLNNMNINGVIKDLLLIKLQLGQFCIDLTGPWYD